MPTPEQLDAIRRLNDAARHHPGTAYIANVTMSATPRGRSINRTCSHTSAFVRWMRSSRPSRPRSNACVKSARP